MARAAKTKTSEETTEETASELIKVVQDGEELMIHPDAEEDHKRLGWERA